MHGKGMLESFGRLENFDRLESLPHRMNCKYSVIDHTADFGIHVYGSDSKELFANAAWALFDLITEMDRLTGLESFQIEVSGDDWSDLMVNWLREVLYLWNGKELLLKKVRILSLSETELSATVECDPFNPDCHIIKTEIKAVTYHQIRVNRSASGWEAMIIFDV
jgi:SHS2 domain-containing protein